MVVGETHHFSKQPYEYTSPVGWCSKQSQGPNLDLKRSREKVTQQIFSQMVPYLDVPGSKYLGSGLWPQYIPIYK